MQNLIKMEVKGTTIEDIRQWCAHNLTKQYRVRALRDFEERLRDLKRNDPKPVYVIVTSEDDRFRLRGSFDIADTVWIFGDIDKY
jgi:hypothetical protein